MSQIRVNVWSKIGGGFIMQSIDFPMIKKVECYYLSEGIDLIEEQIIEGMRSGKISVW